MLPRLCPPVKPFYLAYPRVFFYQLDATLAINGVKEQRTMHAIVLDALPVELRHLAAASSSSPQPYDDLCAAVLAYYGHTYRPLLGTGDSQVSPAPQRVVPTGPQPSHGHEFSSPATTPSTSGPDTGAPIPVPDRDDQVEDAPALTDLPEDLAEGPRGYEGPSLMSATRPSSPTFSARDTSDTPDSTAATSLHALEPATDTDIVTPAVSPPVAEASPSTTSKQPDFSSHSALCAFRQQRPASSSGSTAAEVPTRDQLRPNFRDAATMTEAPVDDVPGPLIAEQTTQATSAIEPDIEHADLHTSPHATTDLPPNCTPAGLHDIPPTELFTGDANQQDGSLRTGTQGVIASMNDHIADPPHTKLRHQSHSYLLRTERQSLTRPATRPRVAVMAFKTAQAPASSARRSDRPRAVHPPSTPPAGTLASGARSRHRVRTRVIHRVIVGPACL